MTFEEVKILHDAIRGCFESPNGRILMDYLEKSCCWYGSVYNSEDRDRTLINAGRREVLATIKTYLKYPADIVHKIIQQAEGE